MSGTFKKQLFDGSVTSNRFQRKGLPRSVEFFIALAGLAVLFPVFLICAILVRKSSRGEIIFRQQRVGRGGKFFTLYKFRTMEGSGPGPLITAANDSRITAVGRILRKWKLDELPEIYNVLRGDMSFVGPRPEVPEFVDLNDTAWNTILKVRPGITDTVTLYLRNEEAVLAAAEDKESFYRETVQPFKMQGYLDYIKIKSAKTDVKIIFQTIKVILFPHTAPPPRLSLSAHSAATYVTKAIILLIGCAAKGAYLTCQA
jgi:lipopolysaccharide/colanic/teichoic acid biosynthesis glycosyltransferase